MRRITGLGNVVVLFLATTSPMLIGAVTAWLFEGIAFFFGSLMVIAYSALVAYYAGFRGRDAWGPPWGLVSFLLVLLGGGFLGICTIAWIAPLKK